MHIKPTVEEIIKCECSPKHAYELMSQNMELKMWCCDWSDDAVRQRQFVGYKRGRSLPWQTTDGENLHAALEEDIVAYRENKEPTIQGHNPANAPTDNLPAPNGRFLDKDEIYQGAPLKATGKVWYWFGTHWADDGGSGLYLSNKLDTYYTTMSRQESDAERRKQMIAECGFKVGDRVKSSSNAIYTIHGLLAWLPTDPMPVDRSDLVDEKTRDKKPFVYMRTCMVSTPVSKLTHVKPSIDTSDAVSELELIPLTPADRGTPLPEPCAPNPTIPGHNPANAPIYNLPELGGRFLEEDEIYQDAPLRTDKVWYWAGSAWIKDNAHELGICYPGVTYYTTMSRQETDEARRKQLIENCGFKVGDRVTDLSGITGNIESLQALLPTDPIPCNTSTEVFDACETKKPFVYASYGACSCPVSKLTHAKPTIAGHNPANAPTDNLPEPGGRFLEEDEKWLGAPLKATGKVWLWWRDKDSWLSDNKSKLGLDDPGFTYYTTMTREELAAERRKQLVENCGFKVGDKVAYKGLDKAIVEQLGAWLPTDLKPRRVHKSVKEEVKLGKPFVFAISYDGCWACPVNHLTHVKPELEIDTSDAVSKTKLVPLAPEDIAKRSDMRVRKKDWNQSEFAVIACVRDDQCFVAQHGIVSLSELLEEWEWLDGSPCGKQPER